MIRMGAQQPRANNLSLELVLILLSDGVAAGEGVTAIISTLVGSA